MSVRFDVIQLGDLVRVTRKKAYHQVICLFPETQEVEVRVGNHTCRFSVESLAEVRR